MHAPVYFHSPNLEAIFDIQSRQLPASQRGIREKIRKLDLKAAMGKPKRNVLAAAQEALSPPAELEPTQVIVRVLKPEGNNLYTCEMPNKKPVVLELAQRFRNTIWIKRGGYVLAEGYPVGTQDSRAIGEIINVVRDEKLWRKQAYWPKEFAKVVEEFSDEESDSNVGKLPPSDDEEEEEEE
ncbi:uncharacterized protein TrAFT101_007998 [Trichoderma asperellum]|nr:hypothetical protein TrAFT101_007998 [Trichoderma asperellum]